MLNAAEKTLIVAGGGIINEEVQGYGVDHVAVAEADTPMAEHRVPVVLEFILERVTNIAMGTEIQNVNEFEEILCLDPSLTIDDVSGSTLKDADGGNGKA